MPTWYGDEASQTFVGDFDADGDVEAGNALALTVWDEPSGGTQITDLITPESDPITSVTTDANGRARFGRPQDGQGPVWVQGPDGERYLFNPRDLVARISASGGPSVPPGTEGQFVGYDATNAPVAVAAPTWDTLSGKPTISDKGEALIAAETDENARSVLGAADAADTVTLSGAQTITGGKTFTTGIAVPDDSLPSSVLNDLDQAVDDRNTATSVVHAVLYNTGDPAPTLPSTGLWVSIEVGGTGTSALEVTEVGGSAGSATDGTSWTVPALTRAMVAGSYGIAVVGLATTGTAAVAPSTLTGLGGVTWTKLQTTTGVDVSGVDGQGKIGLAVYVSDGPADGTTTGTLSASATMQGAVWRIFEVTGDDGAPNAYLGASTTAAAPSLALSGVLASSLVLGFAIQNTNTDMAVGANFTEIGSLVQAPSSPPAVSIKAERAIGAASVTFSGANSATKRLVAIELKAA